MDAQPIRFLLNDEPVSLENIDPNVTVLQYLREWRQRTGTKEGCASGDCGACTVVIAELSPAEPTLLAYQAINACITFIGCLHGKQLITVEHLKDGGKLHGVQQALVDHHGSQCGFCTPGFVMSSFALHKHSAEPTRDEVVEALAGNLCRCTGYRSIIAAAMAPVNPHESDSFTRHYQQTIEQLTLLNQLPAASLHGNSKQYFAPKNVAQLAQALLDEPEATLLAGGTDLALSVTQNLASIEQLIYLGDVAELNTLDATANELIIGAALPYSRFTPLLAREYPDLGDMIARIGSTQIRNRGTLGGNIGNASPIGDMPPALIALGASVVLQRGAVEREVLLEDFFTGYKQTILQPSEFIKSVKIPRAKPGQTLKLYKISKRLDDDISAVLAAVFIELNDNVINNVCIAFGGMAALPKRAKQCELALQGKTLTTGHIRDAQQALTLDFQPMSDVRASDKYRMKVAQNLLQKCYLELQQRPIETRVVHYA